MTDKTPTTAECIEKLKIGLAAGLFTDGAEDLANSIRAQLIAAQEMAKALDDVLEEIQHPQLKQFMRESGITTPKLDRLVVAAIEKKSAWREAGGE